MTTTSPTPPQVELTPTLSRRFDDNPISNEQHVYRFPNGYGASVVRGPHTYGGPGLWEVAVLLYTGTADDDYTLVYDTPVTDDVIGHQSDEDVAAVLLAVAALPERAS